MIKRLLLAIAVLLPMTIWADDAWQTTYPQIEQGITVPTFADRIFYITKYGAKTTNNAAKNQKAINKAIAECSRKGGGRVVVPVTGLNRHAWDENRDMFWSDDQTGLSQHCWASLEMEQL